MKKIRIAVIGGGHLGKIHARLLKQNTLARLVAVCDPQPLAQQAAIHEFNVRATSDFRKITDEVDAAVIATPSRQHAEIARELIAAGKHLLIEKPVTVQASEAREIAALARDTGTTIQVGHVERFNPAIQAALESVGTPKYVEASRQSGFTFRSTDIGVVHDLMIHDIDLACQFFSGTLVGSHAIGMSILSPTEDMAQARLEFSCGGVANLTASRCSFQPERSVRIFGTKGFASVDLVKHQVTTVQVPHWVANRELDFLALDEEQRAYVREHLFAEILKKSAVDVTPVNAIEREQTDWLEAIRDGRQPQVTIEQGWRNVEIAEQIVRQIGEHRWSQGTKALRGPLAKPPAKDLQRVTLPDILHERRSRAA